ncbi:type II toxin-antitoxin system ParD family antitoxin [Corynebacterium aquatimens]|uniref:type II toxin-antitoxin system ParD family antitoxin n=1 Tax=Corynebacterium TaxID=1716 RepID=UPI001F30032E|nr:MULTISPECIES: type II toxin-antitoxin system ParD family antitoxin [Corynebacterium]QYH19623.1 type II toxin-antitoxin system ParD family antitoxin [Corynebacterium aquatimens]UIZ91394.1 type II toxin-antitoxin system ParD family antitoxin [Corynebacterium sp. CNCTC7651]
MAKNTSISLGNHFDSFVAQQVSTGRYATASEVVRAGLRLLEDSELRLGTLRAELEKGNRSATVEDFDFDEFLVDVRRSHEFPA